MRPTELCDERLTNYLVRSEICPYIWAINEQQHAMKTIAIAHGYKVMTNGRTYFVSDGTQCRLATTSKVKAMNCLKSCLKHEGKTI